MLLAVVLLSACGGAKQPSGSGPATQAVHAPLCFPRRAIPSSLQCRSPDGAWSVRYFHGPGRLMLTRLSTGAETVDYSSGDACCSDVAWAPPHRLVFGDDYRVFTLDPVTRKVTFIAGFSDFAVSPNGAWVAGYAAAPPEEPQPAGVVSLGTGSCSAIPGNDDYVGSDFGFAGETPSTGFSKSGSAVIVGVPPTGTAQYAISALIQPCASSLTRRP